MKKSKYLSSILSGILLSSLIFLLAVFYQIGAPTESSRWTYELYTIKTRIAESIKTPKLVIVAGSNALFGISCKMIREQTNVPCVNTATYAGLGVDYILNRARSLVKPGDIVLLPLEYEVYTDDGELNGALIDYVLARDSEYLRSLNWIDQIRFITGVSLTRVQDGILAKLGTPKQWQSHYKSKNLNQYGDDTGNRASTMTKKEFKALDELQPKEIQGYIKSSYGMKVINKFVEWSQENNIKVIATWPNTLWFEAYQEQEVKKFFQSINDFYQNIKVPLLGNYRDFMYDKSRFYDTSYHLNDKGVHYRTKQLIDLLQPFLAKVKKIS